MAVKKIDSPLLIIGLGGTGSEAAYHVKKAFQERLELAKDSDCPRRTRFLIIDTDEDEQTKHGWSRNEFFSIANSYGGIKDNLMPWEAMWFDQQFRDPDNLLGSSNGAGIFRQISRLFLFRRVDGLCAEIEKAIDSVRRVLPGEDAGKKLQIRVLAGLSGGTGSGTILDVPYLIRHVLEDEMHMARQDYSLEGMLVMPDVTIAHHATGETTREELYKANGYAALKEIDFWMNYETHKHRYSQTYSHKLKDVEWKHAPYDDLVLLNSTNLAGARIANPQEHIMQAIAEYMVNCFSADYDVAEGISEIKYDQNKSTMVESKSAGVATFEAQRSNDLAQLNTIRKEFFVPYRYRSIGAFSNAGDETNILNRQWDLILEASVGSIDKNKPLMDGVEPVNFRKLCIDQTVGWSPESSLRRKYEELHPIQDVFGSMKAEDLRQMASEIAPHNSDFNTFKENIRLARGNDRITLEEEGKSALHRAFTEIVCDLKRGPDYCCTLLTHASEGLLKALTDEETIVARKQQESESFVQDYSGLDGNCDKQHVEIRTTGWPRFLLKGGTLFENYKKNVNDLYAAAQAAGYYRALKEAIPELKRYTKLYAALLGDMCKGLRSRHEDYKKRVNAAQTADGAAVRLLDNARVEESLIQAFNEEMRRDTLVQTAFQTISDAVDEALSRNQETMSEKEAQRIIQRGIEQVRSRSFSAIDTMTIESKLSAFGTVNGRELDVYTKDEIMPKLVRGAMPMFHAGYALSPENKNVVQSYMGTVPASAPNIQRGIVEYMRETSSNTYANLKFSNVSDRLFWVTSVMGMPMMACADLGGWYETYLTTRTSHHGIHLCMYNCNDLNDTQMQNWGLLPEPTCKRFEALSAVEQEAKSYYVKEASEGDNAAPEINQRVLMIHVNFELENNRYTPKASIQWKRLRPIGATQHVTLQSMDNSIKNVLATRRNVMEIIEALNALRDGYDVVDITPDGLVVKAQAWAIVLGLGKEVNMPIGTERPLEEQERLKKVWVQCIERAAFEYVSRNPQLMGYMKTNQACFDLIDDQIAVQRTREFDVVLENAEYFGKMHRFGLISLTLAGGEYVSSAIRRDNSGIYSPGDTAKDGEMREVCPGFAEYPIDLQNILYYAHKLGGRDPRDRVQREALSTVEKKYNDWLRNVKSARDLSIAAAERELPDIASYIQNARDMEDRLAEIDNEMTGLFAQGSVTEKERAEAKRALERIRTETQIFTKIWRNVEL